MTGKNLNDKPSTVQQARFDYFSLKKCFNKGLQEKDKQEGFLKRLQNIENKNKEQLKAIKNKTGDITEGTNLVDKPLSLEANALTDEIKSIQKLLITRK